MNAIIWAKNMLENENSQALLEEKVELLLKSVLMNKDDYQKEKAIKSFSEGIRYLESLLQYKKGIHRNQIDLIKVQQNPEEYLRKQKEIEDIIASEINRQYRHFTVFL